MRPSNHAGCVDIYQLYQVASCLLQTPSACLVMLFGKVAPQSLLSLTHTQGFALRFLSRTSTNLDAQAANVGKPLQLLFSHHHSRPSHRLTPSLLCGHGPAPQPSYLLGQGC